jgi:hypothetical protein
MAINTKGDFCKNTNKHLSKIGKRKSISTIFVFAFIYPSLTLHFFKYSNCGETILKSLISKKEALNIYKIFRAFQILNLNFI